MDEPFAVFDTLTVRPDAVVIPPRGGDSPIKVLMRMPRVEKEADQRAKDRQLKPYPVRVDAAESAPAPHLLAETGVNLAEASQAFEATTLQPAAVPATTRRGFSPERVDRLVEQPAPAPEAPETETEETAIDSEEWGDNLLRLEAAIAPFSRWIALAAVLAALGLTAVLLRGVTQTVLPGDSSEGDPATKIEEATQSALADIGPLEPLEPLDLAPTPALPPEVSGPQIASTAEGPAAQAELTGEVLALPKAAGPPYPSTTPRIAKQPGQDGYPTTEGNLRR